MARASILFGRTLGELRLSFIGTFLSPLSRLFWTIRSACMDCIATKEGGNKKDRIKLSY